MILGVRGSTAAALLSIVVLYHIVALYCSILHNICYAGSSQYFVICLMYATMTSTRRDPNEALHWLLLYTFPNATAVLWGGWPAKSLMLYRYEYIQEKNPSSLFQFGLLDGTFFYTQKYFGGWLAQVTLYASKKVGRMWLNVERPLLQSQVQKLLVTIRMGFI
jgi:hypothetical protein